MTIKKYIPDTITCLNLLSGILGIVSVFQGYYQLAFMLMLLAAVFDFFDGFAARLLGAYSDLGKELDSLSDVVSFGVLPSLMMVCRMAADHGGVVSDAPVWSKIICFLPLLVAIFSAVRLAKFNIDSRQSSSFLGLPTPACAMLCGSLMCYVAIEPQSFLAAWSASFIFLPMLSLVLALLLVSEVPMFSMKFHKGDSLRSAAYIKLYILAAVAVASIVAVLVAGLHWSLIFSIVFGFYILENLFCAVIGK